MKARILLQLAVRALNEIVNTRSIPGVPGAPEPFNKEFTSYQLAAAIDKHLAETKPKMRDSYRTTLKQLFVVGHMWGGGKGSHTYDVSLRADMDTPTTLRAAKLIAGDFESLESATLVTTVREIEETVTRTPLT